MRAGNPDFFVIFGLRFSVGFGLYTKIDIIYGSSKCREVGFPIGEGKPEQEERKTYSRGQIPMEEG